jgi:hypothetical protein
MVWFGWFGLVWFDSTIDLLAMGSRDDNVRCDECTATLACSYQPYKVWVAACRGIFTAKKTRL